jgi:hypothetical protein
MEFMVLQLELCLLPGLYGSAYNLIFWMVIEIIQQWMDAGAPEYRRGSYVNFKPTHNQTITFQRKVLDS